VNSAHNPTQSTPTNVVHLKGEHSVVGLFQIVNLHLLAPSIPKTEGTDRSADETIQTDGIRCLIRTTCPFNDRLWILSVVPL
jgi:hypothetical protein